MCNLTQIRRSFIEREGHYWMTAEMLGERLGYSYPREAVNKIVQRNRDELNPLPVKSN